LSAIENLRISTGVAGNSLKKAQAQQVLERIGLKDRQHLPAVFFLPVNGGVWRWLDC